MPETATKYDVERSLENLYETGLPIHHLLDFVTGMKERYERAGASQEAIDIVTTHHERLRHLDDIVDKRLASSIQCLMARRPEYLLLNDFAKSMPDDDIGVLNNLIDDIEIDAYSRGRDRY